MENTDSGRGIRLGLDTDAYRLRLTMEEQKAVDRWLESVIGMPVGKARVVAYWVVGEGQVDIEQWDRFDGVDDFLTKTTRVVHPVPPPVVLNLAA